MLNVTVGFAMPSLSLSVSDNINHHTDSLSLGPLLPFGPCCSSFASRSKLSRDSWWTSGACLSLWMYHVRSLSLTWYTCSIIYKVITHKLSNLWTWRTLLPSVSWRTPVSLQRTTHDGKTELYNLNLMQLSRALLITNMSDIVAWKLLYPVSGMSGATGVSVS